LYRQPRGLGEEDSGAGGGTTGARNVDGEAMAQVAAATAASSSLLRQCKFLTLSFSGAGHLLPYHLGAATAIRGATKNDDNELATRPIRVVSGSSSGAIAAALFVYFPAERVREYADRFISDGGRAMYHFKEMIDETAEANRDGIDGGATTLHVATTRCSDGALHVFDFPPNPPSVFDKTHLVRCLEASCKIPQQFHPSDVLPSRWPSTYPEEEGVFIDGSSYVDGGISAPAPPAPLASLETNEGACRVVISPISGGNTEKNMIRISPADDSWKFPVDIRCRGGFSVHPSVQNIKALQVSAGLAPTSILQEWYDRGYEDATKIMAT